MPILADDELPWWLSLMTPEVIVVLLVLVLVLVLVAVVGGLLAYRRVRRSPRWSRALLVLQAEHSPPGPRRELAQLRLRVEQAVARAKGALATLDASGAPRGELASLVRRAERIGRALEAQLRLLQGDPDDHTLRQSLWSARDRVDELERIVRRIRQAAADTLSGEMDSVLKELTADVEREVLALQAGVEALQALTLGGPLARDERGEAASVSTPQRRERKEDRR